MLQNKIDCKSLETSQENICNGVYFNKGASLKCRDCNTTKTDFNTDSFRTMIRQLDALNKYFEKKGNGEVF